MNHLNYVAVLLNQGTCLFRPQDTYRHGRN